MVDSVSSLNRAIALLRQSIGAAPQAAPVRPTALQQNLKTKAGKTPATTNSHVATLHGRLAALRVDDPQRSRKALRLFIEAVFLDQFGGELILDAAFQDLVDQSLSAIEADASLQETINRAALDLLTPT
jgi:hypothetical protein